MSVDAGFSKCPGGSETRAGEVTRVTDALHSAEDEGGDGKVDVAFAREVPGARRGAATFDAPYIACCPRPRADTGQLVSRTPRRMP
ncbi:hypothetical protein BH11GEM2_BH11GEM2_16010 [soil metagenome]